MPKSLSVLVVDDDRANLQAMAQLLRRRGHRVMEASSAQAALVLLATHSVDIVISDCDMPGKTGPQAFRDYAGEGGTVPWIFISGVTRRDDLPQDCRFLAKPIKSQALFGLLETIGALG